MSEYQPALDQLRERRKGKPGELLLMIGMALMFIAPFALVLTNQDGEKLVALQSEGKVAEATVKDKSVRAESYTDRKGRAKTRELYNLNLSHDLNAQLDYADWKAGKTFPKPQFPAVTTREIEVGSAYYEALVAGQKTTVIHNPTDYKSMMLTEQLEYETSLAYRLWWYLGTAIAVLAGLAMAVIGWRKRKANA
ncbi:MAG: hypothetical protein ACK4SJ_06495 [Sphingorhabdus sp.]